MARVEMQCPFGHASRRSGESPPDTPFASLASLPWPPVRLKAPQESPPARGPLVGPGLPRPVRLRPNGRPPPGRRPPPRAGRRPRPPRAAGPPRRSMIRSPGSHRDRQAVHGDLDAARREHRRRGARPGSERARARPGAPQGRARPGKFAGRIVVAATTWREDVGTGSGVVGRRHGRLRGDDLTVPGHVRPAGVAAAPPPRPERGHRPHGHRLVRASPGSARRRPRRAGYAVPLGGRFRRHGQGVRRRAA